jgi:hypothetical protein
MKLYLYETDKFVYVLDTKNEFWFDEEDGKFEISDELVRRYIAVADEFDLIQDELCKIYMKNR